MLNLVISWFVDLTFQAPMQYCSLQHWILLLSPVPSTTGWCFCFGAILSFFLELFLHWSPVAYWVPTDLGSSSFSILSFAQKNISVINRRMHQNSFCYYILQTQEIEGIWNHQKVLLLCRMLLLALNIKIPHGIYMKF